MSARRWIVRAGVVLVLLVLPRMIYPILAVDILAWGLFALAFAQMVDFIARQADKYTGGDNGLPGIPRPPLGPLHFDNPLHLYYFTLALAGLGYLIAARAIESPFGQALRAIRDNRVRAQSVGYNPRVQMLVAFLLSAGLSGLAGGLHTVGHGVVSLDAVNWSTSGIVVMMTLLGGTGTLLGPLVGATLVLLLQDALAFSTSASGVVTGAVFALTVLFFRRGVVGTLLALDLRRRAGERFLGPAK